MGRAISIYFPKELDAKISANKPETSAYGAVVKYLVIKGLEAIENERKLIKGKK